MPNSGNEPVAESVELIDSQSDEYPGDYDLRMVVNHETFYLTIGHGGSPDFKVALEAVKRGGIYTLGENDG